MKPNIGFSEVDQNALAKILNTVLSDEFVLYTKTLNFHWNVTGPDFYELHLFFEKQYQQLAQMIDDVAERVRAIGEYSFGSMITFVECSRLDEAPALRPSAEHMIAMLLADHEALIRHLRSDLEIVLDEHKDAGTNNFLTDLMQKHEKMAWMLRAMLPTKES